MRSLHQLAQQKLTNQRPEPATGAALLARLWIVLLQFAARLGSRPRADARAAESLAVALLLAISPSLVAAAIDAQSVMQLTTAERVVAADARFPTALAAQTVSLPDEWRAATVGPSPTVWYRVVFDTPPIPLFAGRASKGSTEPITDDGEPISAVLIERACGRVWILLNGHKLHADEPGTEASGRLCHGARVLSLPGSLLRERGNELDIRIQGQALESVTARQRAGGLSTVQIGPYAVLSRRHEQLRMWQLTSVQVAGLTLSVLGLFVAAMGWLNRRDSTFVYFGLMAVGWAVITLRAAWGGFSIGPVDSQWLLAAIVAPVTAAAVLFLLRFVGYRERWVDLALWSQLVLMPVSLLMLSPRHAFVTASTWYALFGAQVLMAGAYTLWRTWQREQREAWPIVLILGLALSLIVAEIVAQFGWIDLQGAQVAHFGISVLMMSMAFRLIQTFAESLRSAERARVSMEVRVAEATAEIERNFAQLAELRVEQVTEKERKRIAADLHDDLGAKLLTIVHTSESERISTLAREALEEMRLSVRGLTGKPVRVADALADWRAETVARLGQAGMDADWRSPTEELEQRLAARTYVQTTRILREAVSNIIKHSSATHCKVRCAIGSEDFVLTIQDNGRGISTELSNKLDRGQGMYSMKNRAKQMQGQCLVESGPGYGTVIRLTLPLTERTIAPAQT